MKLPIISGKKLIKLLSKQGFEIAGRKGSHVRLKKKTPNKALVTIVPLHKNVRTKCLKSLDGRPLKEDGAFRPSQLTKRHYRLHEEGKIREELGLPPE